MRAGAAFVFFLVALTTGIAAAAPAKLVYRIDRATATIAHNRFVIVARGAVSTGGWEKPLLRLQKTSVSEASTLEVEFVATPPHPRAAVAHAILPVSARLAAPLPRTGVVQVKIVSQTNSVIVPVTRLSGTSAQPHAVPAAAYLARQSN
ncbi:MAG TPA: hypothetical protein VGC27_08950 [Rhizomicrobium sp.]